VIRQPEPELSKVNAVDVIFCRAVLFVQPGLQMSGDIAVKIYFFSQHSRKPNVVRCYIILKLNVIGLQLYRKLEYSF
jgi:hypothetical protein